MTLSDRFGSVRRLAGSGLAKSLASLVIKVAAAGLTYGMYVLMSRTMGASAYGLFAFGLSLATILSILACLGQQTAVLRYWPEENVRGRPEAAVLAVRAGTSLTLWASLAFGVGVLVVALLLALFVPAIDPWLYAATGALVVPMALAEYLSAALRAQGAVWTALLPRDVVWRVVTPLAVIVLVGLQADLSGPGALWLAAAVLAVALVVQVFLAQAQGLISLPVGRGVGDYWQHKGKASVWFLAGTGVDSAALNVDIILVGLFVTSASAGIYFNAFRTAGLLTLFMFALTLVIGPVIARHFHAGALGKAQMIATLAAWAGFLFSALVFVGFLAFGDLVLALFGDTSAEGTLILLILAFGFLYEAATGQARIIMMMTGHERAYVVIFGSIMGAGLVLQLVTIPLFGVLAAAVVNVLARMVAQTALVVWCLRKVGIDPSLFGALQLLRGRAATAEPEA